MRPLNLADTLPHYLSETDTQIVVAYSGGIDSEVLLHLAHQFVGQFPHHNLSAIHIHHGLSQFADAWQAHCQARCEILGIPLKTIRVEVSGEGGIEASARAARYAALAKHAPDGAVILLAQHADDQLETFLLQLKRGAGPKGLASMPAYFNDQQGQKYVRPLLAVSKQDIKNYADENRLEWVEDDSNHDIRYDRNFLRKQVIPILTERWPQLSDTVSRSARLCAEQQDLLDEVLAQRIEQIKSDDGGIDLDALKGFSSEWQKQLLRFWLDQQRVRLPSVSVLDEILKMLDAQEDANPIVRWESWQIRRFDQTLYLVPLIDDELNVQLPIELGSMWSSQDGGLDFTVVEGQECGQQCLGLGITSGQIEIRFDNFSQRFKPLGEANSKPLKQWFKQWKVPPWIRQRVPRIYIEGVLCALWLDNRWIVSDEHRSKNGLFLQSDGDQ